MSEFENAYCLRAPVDIVSHMRSSVSLGRDARDAEEDESWEVDGG
jgi:hypothetical protein